MLKTISERPVSAANARKVLEDKEKERHEAEKELGYEQKITLEYLRSMPMVSAEVAEEAFNSLKEAVPDFKDHQAVMILDMMPRNEEEMQLLFAKERLKISKEQIEKTLEIIDKIRPKDKIQQLESAKKRIEEIAAAAAEKKEAEEREEQESEEQKEEAS